MKSKSKTNPDSHPSFLFTTCQVGAEKTLKKEMLRDYSNFHFSYSKPGFLTFKSLQGDVPLDFPFKSVFARTFGVCFSQLKDTSTSIQEFVASVLVPGQKVRLHVWERDIYVSDEAPRGFVYGSFLEGIEKKVRTENPGLFEKSVQASVGDLVIDIIALDPRVYWWGAHIHSGYHSPWPGGRVPLVLPPAAPSRAYLKCEEALLWSGAPIRTDDTALEIGSAPGGASFALLNRGLKVVGIDPAEMDPRVLRHPHFRHFQMQVNGVLREDLPEEVHWVLLDMNVEPRISLFSVDRLVSRMKSSVLGVLLTIKLNRWSIADEIPSMLEHVRAMGMVKIKAGQLANNRQEFMIYGLTRKGKARMIQ